MMEDYETFISQAKLLQLIHTEAEFLVNSSHDLDLEQFIANQYLTRAFVWSLLVIAQATRELSPALKNEYAQTEFNAIEGFRTRLLREWHEQDYEMILEFVVKRIVPLKTAIESVIQEEEEEGNP